jgi:ribosome biogenesis GTPase / thiamine phosphate phosphatase
MLEFYGWSPELQHRFDALAQNSSYVPARVLAHHRDLWRVVTSKGERNARLSGRLAADAAEGGYPVVGDWLAVSDVGGQDASIHAVVPRRSVFKRRMAGGQRSQILAANIDVALLVAALNGDLNPRRLERYLVAARDANTTPVIVLTKADLCADPASETARIAEIAGGAPVTALAALHGAGLEQLEAWLKPGVTAVLLGSSGAGKSTLLNALLGAEAMTTGAVREADDRGRHTTTHREMFCLSSGALLVDTPGMRELGLLAEDDALNASFADVVALAGDCRFGNCQHQSEPGCAILGAIGAGTLSAERWRAYQKLERELAFAARREDASLQAVERQKWKRIHKAQRERYKARDE